MEIILYKTLSENKSVPKSFVKTRVLSGDLRAECNIKDPSLIIESADFLDYNYMYIPAFGRFYFLDAPTVVREGLYLISGHVDVLQTAWDEIKGLKPVIKRQEHLYNMYMRDDRLEAQADTFTVAKDIGNRVFSIGNVFLTVQG